MYRHAQLIVVNLPEHPDTAQPENRTALARAKKEVGKNLRKLESLQPRINKRYERFEQLIRNRDARRASATADRFSDPQASEYSTQADLKRPDPDPAIPNETGTLTAGENRDLAVQLAHKEIRRRATARKATRQAGISEEVENERRTAGVWGNWEDALVTKDENPDRDTLSEQMQNVRSQVVKASQQEVNNRAARPSTALRSKYYYPTIPEHRRTELKRIPSFTPDSPESHSPSPAPPPIPGKDHLSAVERDIPPARPAKDLLQSEPAPSTDGHAPDSSNVQPSALTFKPSAYLENGTPLRTIFLPPDLRHQFVSIARPNTQANVETCGVLCGTLISNALFISKLVIPEQKSTSDTCETVNESDLFDYVDGEDLMMLGWIHTHPTQTCFMSSRDLHTHSGYQVMLPESIAIVCAPSKGEWGVFRLTDPPGMRSILNCTQTGLFHPHAENNIYTDALRPGHVFEAKGLEFEVVDMRP